MTAYTQGARKRARRNRRVLREAQTDPVSGTRISPPYRRANGSGFLQEHDDWMQRVLDRCRALGLAHDEATAKQLRAGGTCLDIWAIEHERAGNPPDVIRRCVDAGRKIFRQRAACAAYGLPPRHPRQPEPRGEGMVDPEKAHAAWERWCEVHDAIRALGGRARWEVEHVCLDELRCRAPDALRDGLERMAKWLEG